MAVNLVNRTPVPGSLGAPVGSGVQFTLQVTGGGNIPLPTVDVSIASELAYTNSAFEPTFTGTVTADGSGGWIFDVQPAADFDFDTTISVQVSCTEQPAGIPFSQTYSFHTVRNIQISAGVEYQEDSDTITFLVYPYEVNKKVPSVIQSGEVRVLNPSTIPGGTPTLLDSITFSNNKNVFNSDGTFNVRFLHPAVVRKSMTYEIRMDTDPYQAPNVGTVVSSGNIVFVSKKPMFVDTQTQPYPQGEIHRPRIEYDGIQHLTFQIDSADYQSVNLADSVKLPDVLTDIVFTDGLEHVHVLTGGITYTGGGNRLLRELENTFDFILQAEDDFAPIVGARTLVEPGTENLFPDSAFLTGTNPFTTGGTDTTVITESSISPVVISKEDNETPLVNAASFIFEGMSIYDGVTRHAWATSPTIDYESGEDVLISSLVRIAYRDSAVTLTNFKFIAQFYNNLGNVIHSIPVVYDPKDFVSEREFYLAENFIPAAVIPLAAVKVGFTIDFDSFESCDRIEVYLLGPSIEYKTFTTSRTVSEKLSTVRKPDDVRIPQVGNINISSGTVVVEFAPTYDGVPPETATLFDSRSVSGLLNGFLAQHTSTGFIEFSVVDSSGGSTVVSSPVPVNLSVGESVTLIFSWDDSTISIKKNTDIIQTFTGPYTLPDGINYDISIGSTIDNKNYLLSELRRFTIYSRPVS